MAGRQRGLAATSGVVQHDPTFTTSLANGGNVTTVKQYFHAESRFLSSASRYDILGNVLQVTDPMNRTITTQ